MNPAADSGRMDVTASPHVDTRPAKFRFYTPRSYGSDLEFSPLSVAINEGFDMLRVADHRDVLNIPYWSSFKIVWHSVTDPEPVIRHYGWSRWLRNEVFPLTLKSQGGGQWYPNYHLHLFGSGITYVRTTEWFEQHGNAFGHPELAAGVTLYVGHVLNEILESGNVCCEDEDGMTDLLIFDSGAIILWNQEWMRRAFSGRIEATDWYGQPTLTLPNKHLENAYSLIMVRAPLPRTDNWKVMTTAGSAFLVGASRRVGDQYWVSASGGFDPSDNPVIDSATNTKTVTLQPNAGLFLDRNGSLLASFISKGGGTNGPTINLYPGLFRLGPLPSPGFWVQQIRGGGMRMGITSGLGVGLGAYHQ